MPRRPSLFGPLVWWELVRLARLGQATRARILVLYSLLLAIFVFAFWWSYPASPLGLFLGTSDPFLEAGPNLAERQRRLAQFARSLAVVLLEAQLLIVAFITPAYAAAAVAEEKDRRTLEMLLTTDLTDREILWGKFAARVLFVLSAVVAGVPVLMTTLLFGGVDVGLLVAGNALTVGTVVLSSAIGVSAACHAPDSRTALVRAYGQSAAFVFCVLIPPFVLLSPFAMLIVYYLATDDPGMRMLVAFGYPVTQLAIAWVFLIEAKRGIRKLGPTAGPPEPTVYPEPPRGRAVWVLSDADDAPPSLPPIDDADPLLWKERHSGRNAPLPVLDRPVRIFGALVAVAAFTLFAIGGFQLLERTVSVLNPVEAERMLRRGPEPPDLAGGVLTAAGVLAAALYLLPLTIGVTGCVAGERFRGTLDSLLTIPLGRRGMLWSKVRAHTERGLLFAGVAGAALGAGFWADGGVKLGLLAIAAFGAGVVFVVGVGAWLSVRCATPLRAFRLCLPAVVAVIGLPVLVWNTTQWDRLNRPMEALAWSAGVLAAIGIVLWWRAAVAMETCGSIEPPRDAER